MNLRKITAEIRKQGYEIADARARVCQDIVLKGITITRIGKIQELSQQDYHGKRVLIRIVDEYGNVIDSKIDLGVHKHLEIEQEEFCFDIAFDDEGASLLINSKEQMFVEKLRSLLKFGEFSTRYKDIYDMYYYCDKVDVTKLRKCLNTYIFNDIGMRENSIKDIVKRIGDIFNNDMYRIRVDNSDKRWIDDKIEVIFEKIIQFLNSLDN